jgi:hypothetical protein
MRKICWIVAAFSFALPAQAAPFGDVDISVVLQPKGNSVQGSSEYVFAVINKSATQAHRVTLTIPAEAGYGDDRIIAVSRTVEVRANETARVSLIYPIFPPITGSSVKVIVDGRTYGDRASPAIGLSLASSSSMMGRGGRVLPLVLISQTVPQQFRTGAQDMRNQFGGTFAENQVEQEKSQLAGWSTNWQGYTRYDAVVIAAREWLAAPEGPRNALWQYAETGGCLIFLEGGMTLPERWSKVSQTFEDVKIHPAGFGTIAVIPDANIATWSPARWEALYRTWSHGGAPPQPNMSAQEANNRFPVVDDVQIPVRGLFVLMVIFTIVIGPGNLWVLARMHRRIWMLWTVPAIALLTCAAVFGYMLVSEGWSGESRIEAITILDETTDRATSTGWIGVYSPMTPGDGLHFSPASELMWLKQREDYYSYRRSGNSGSACTIDWTADQHFASGWVSARVPSHFKLRKSESAQHRRISVDRAADGSLTATNALGADVKQLWYADEKGVVYSADTVQAGAKVTLNRRADRHVGARPSNLRLLLTNDNWLTPKQVHSRPNKPGVGMKKLPPTTPAVRWPEVKGEPPGWGGGVPAIGVAKGPGDNPELYILPRSYIAVLDGAPFIESPLRGTRASDAKSTVIGLMKEIDAAP